MTTTGNKSESGISLKRFESGNVLTASFWRSGGDLEITKNNKRSIRVAKINM